MSKRLDEILDKIKKVGYARLTAEEKDYLDKASKDQEPRDVPDRSNTPTVWSEKGRLMVGDQPVDEYQKRPKTSAPTPLERKDLHVRVYRWKSGKKRTFYMFRDGESILYGIPTDRPLGTFYITPDPPPATANELWATAGDRYGGHVTLNKTDSDIFSNFVDVYRQWRATGGEQPPRLKRLYDYVSQIGTEGPLEAPPRKPTPKNPKGGNPDKREKKGPIRRFKDWMSKKKD